MNKGTIIGIIILVVVITIIGTAQWISVVDNYELLSNEEIRNMTNNAYLSGILYVSQTGTIPFINNQSIEEISIEQLCSNLNTQQEVQQSQQ
tara:strand:+ start:516 stop:791 length:276 start_codon:yes stop_codon:yes gene_type:complete